MSTGYRTPFESLARALLAAHPAVRHEWRVVEGWGGDKRLDLILVPPSSGVSEVWASLRDYQLTVGDDAEDTDFESWGRDLTNEQVAAEAFEHFVALMRRHQYLDSRHRLTAL